MNRFAPPVLLAAAAILGVVCLAPIPAAAQSAEETVAFMLWGLEEGAKTKRVANNLWEAETDNGDQFSLGILRLTDCRFRVSNHMRRAGALEVLEFDHILDFAAVHDYSAWFANGSDQRIIVKVEGKSWYSKTVRSKTTGRVLQNVSGGSVDAYVAAGGSVERLQSAFAHFRSAFCGRRAAPLPVRRGISCINNAAVPKVVRVGIRTTATAHVPVIQGPGCAPSF